MANAANMYSAIFRALSYRGVGLLQCYTTCQPEHGVGDDSATIQATLIRDSRGMPEFVFDPARGESYDEALSLKANRAPDRDWWNKRSRSGDHYDFTVAHFARTEARFRRHFFGVKEAQLADMESLDHALLRISQQDIVHRNHLRKDHRSFMPKKGVYTMIEMADGTLKPVGLSRQMVLFCVERRKAWRMLQSKAGIVNHDRRALERVLREFDEGKIEADIFAEQLPALIEHARQASLDGDATTSLAELLELSDTVH